MKDVKPEDGTVPNGITPGSQRACGRPVQVVALVDGLGGGPSVKYVTGGTKNRGHRKEAVAYAAGQVKRPDKNYLRLCAHSMSWYYGYYSYGYPSASAGGNATPKKLRHSVKDPKSIPAGALVYFVNQGQYGHVVLSNGDGRVYSNDINRAGKIDLVPLSVFKRSGATSPASGRLRTSRTQGTQPQSTPHHQGSGNSSPSSQQEGRCQRSGTGEGVPSWYVVRGSCHGAQGTGHFWRE